MNPGHDSSFGSPRWSRRHFLGLSVAGVSALNLGRSLRAEAAASAPAVVELEPGLAEAVKGLEPFFTSQEKFRDVSRGKPLPHSLPTEKKHAVGLTRATWKLEVVSDPDHPARLLRPLTIKDRTALDFDALLKLAEGRAVRFAKTMTCLNIGCPLGTGIWEGLPLREVLWLTRPRENLRRIFYHGYHNDDPQQMFRSSLPIDRVLEDPVGFPPVILCYKLNGEYLNSERGGPVRIVVPEAYGFKSIKWLTRIVLSNLFHANDTYADGNNDVDSTLKTFAATLSFPKTVKAGEPIPVTGYAQIGTSGLSKVQVWMHANTAELPAGDPDFTRAPWTDTRILPPPENWGAIPGGRIPANTLGFDSATGRPIEWPMCLAKIYWAALLPGQPAGEYTLRCRTIDRQGAAQPMPRPFQKSGHAAIEAVELTIEG